MTSAPVGDPNPPRGCGYRKAGGVYAECALGPKGVPVDNCIVDPPIIVDESALQLPKRGSVLRAWGDAEPLVWHLFDRIGEQFYPNVADKVEEVRIRGESRRLNSGSIDFSKITPATRLILLHRRAHIANSAEVYRAYGAWPPPAWVCPRHWPAHDGEAVCTAPPAEMCAAAWWRDLAEGAFTLGDAPDPEHPDTRLRSVRRVMPGLSYDGWARPAGVTPRYQTAIFMILPLTRLAVVRGDCGEHEASLQAAQRAGVPVELVEV